MKQSVLLLSKELSEGIDILSKPITGVVRLAYPKREGSDTILVLDTQQDLIELSDSLYQLAITKRAVPYRIDVDTFSLDGPPIQVDDSFYNEIPGCEVFYSKPELILRLFQLLDTGGIKDCWWWKDPYSVGFILNKNGAAGLIKGMEYDSDLLVEMADDTVYHLILKSPLNQGYPTPVGIGTVDIQVRYQDMSTASFKKEIEVCNSEAKRVLREIMTGLTTIPKFIQVDDSPQIGVYGSMVNSAIMSEADRMFDLSQAMQRIVGTDFTVLGLDTGDEFKGDRVDQVIWSASKTNRRMCIASDRLNSDFYIFLT